MLNSIFKNLSHLPQFKGKLTILTKIYEIAPNSIERTLESKMIPGHKMSLLIADRIQRRMFIKKSHEPETEFHMQNNFLKAKTFLDIGANVGYFTMMAKAINPNMKIYSFEPNPNNVGQIKKNIQINDFSNIEVSSLCVSDAKGSVSFSVPPVNESGWGRITNNHLPLENFTTIRAEAISLDELDADNFFKIESPLFVKMDVEGNEYRILKGATNFIKKYQPTFCIELNEPCLKDCGTSSKEIIHHMKELGYECYYIHHDKLIKTDRAIDGYENLNYWFIQ